jgi:uncharacterized OB-fold protein
MPDSPRAIFLEHARHGELVYQAGPVFYPRVGGEWRVSSGRGIVYATTTVHRRGGETYNVSLIELDEGFRMMSTVEADDVHIGMAVQVRMRIDDDEPVPVFVPVGDGG